MAKARLRLLAKSMRFDVKDYKFRTNQGGVAVSGEIILHHVSVYIQVSQSALGPNMGILIRKCNGLKDFTGGMNNFAPFSALDGDLSKFASHITHILNS